MSKQPQDIAKREPNDELRDNLYDLAFLTGADSETGERTYAFVESELAEFIQQDREQYAYEYAKKTYGTDTHIHDGAAGDEATWEAAQNSLRSELHNRNDQLKGKMK
ncbi:hypothetical protein [Rhodococcus ruber]|uniref:hypothetical protein n=1 Tax=Rhodococcus ruber TaxID=1830 RepID=UPI001F2A1F99|nr:hypothetical protein [Rhodococcus ruber]MCF8783219.1 hypothetical protein [Rhodococcus ruber]